MKYLEAKRLYEEQQAEEQQDVTEVKMRPGPSENKRRRRGGKRGRSYETAPVEVQVPRGPDEPRDDDLEPLEGGADDVVDLDLTQSPADPDDDGSASAE